MQLEVLTKSWGRVVAGIELVEEGISRLGDGDKLVFGEMLRKFTNQFFLFKNIQFNNFQFLFLKNPRNFQNFGHNQFLYINQVKYFRKLLDSLQAYLLNYLEAQRYFHLILDHYSILVLQETFLSRSFMDDYNKYFLVHSKASK